jgi:acetylglutamate kinase
MGIESRFVHGLRVTTPEAMAVVEMVLAGQVNKEIAALIQSAGGQAVGISGKDGRLITARKLDLATHVGEELEDLPDIGLVGQVEHVNARLIEALMNDGFIPVIAPVGLGMGGETYNINADTVAAEVAVALQASKLVLLTDVPGVQDASGGLLSSLSCVQAERLIKDGQITGGMVPKIKGAVAVVHRGVGKVHIIDGRLPHALLLEIFTDRGIGTEVIG